MTAIGKLLDTAHQAPASLSVGELCRLVEAAGYAMARTKGSHRIYLHERRPELPIINLQKDRSGKGVRSIRRSWEAGRSRNIAKSRSGVGDVTDRDRVMKHARAKRSPTRFARWCASSRRTTC